MAYVLVVKLTAREGEEERAVELIRGLVEASSAEPGVVHYVAHRDPEDPRVFLMYEQYADEAAYEAHGTSDHFKTIALGELFPLMESRERAVYETLE
jgi:quinol monooxygenase YgiN